MLAVVMIEVALARKRVSPYPLRALPLPLRAGKGVGTVGTNYTEHSESPC